MQIKCYSAYQQFRASGLIKAFDRFIAEHPHSNYFQSTAFLELLEELPDYRGFVLLASDDNGVVKGALTGSLQTNGQGLKSWFSRRIIVYGGPVVEEESPVIASAILQHLIEFASKRATYIEIRNLFDTSPMKSAFKAVGFEYRPHLNILVKTNDREALLGKISKSRLRQIKSSLKAGAAISEPESREEVLAFYGILKSLYQEKVKKPLPGPELFLKLWKAAYGKLFLVKYDGQVVGGMACPVFKNRVIYEWYVCGLDGRVKGVYPSVLATWSAIDYALKNKLEYFDFLGAGPPDKDYGVREFKARFGGEQVNYGRYHLILDKMLYRVGTLGLKAYKRVPALFKV